MEKRSSTKSCPAEEAVEICIDVTSLTEPGVAETSQDRKWDTLKSIVYGGLIASITSLGVVSSAAGVGASTCKLQKYPVSHLVHLIPMPTHC